MINDCYEVRATYVARVASAFVALHGVANVKLEDKILFSEEALRFTVT